MTTWCGTKNYFDQYPQYLTQKEKMKLKQGKGMGTAVVKLFFCL